MFKQKLLQFIGSFNNFEQKKKKFTTILCNIYYFMISFYKAILSFFQNDFIPHYRKHVKFQ